jgi:hypothetical protein
MRVLLEVTIAPNGVPHGTVTWEANASVTVPFHGTLELMAVVESAVGQDRLVAGGEGGA